jgi:hypothetical protein
MVRGLPLFREAVPNERVTVGRKAFVLCGLCLEEKFVRRCPLLSCEVEGRLAMRDGDDDAASRQHVGRVARVARRGVKAEGVLNAHVGRTELGQIAEDAVTSRHVRIVVTLARPCGRGTFLVLGVGRLRLSRVRCDGRGSQVLQVLLRGSAPSLGLVPRKPRAYTEGLFHFAARGSDLRYLFSSDEDRETFTSKAPSPGPFE